MGAMFKVVNLVLSKEKSKWIWNTLKAKLQILKKKNGS